MKYLLIGLAFFASSCSHETPTFLEGEWKSNKELTIAHFNKTEELTSEKREFLEKNLGEMVIAFKGKKTAIYFAKSNEIEWGTFKVLNKTEASFSISVTNSILKSQQVTYIWDENCFYLEQNNWGYNEYFCKIE
jgi:hypothetical protein